MEHKSLLYLIGALLMSINTAAQSGPEMSVAFLENDNIAGVNIDKDSFIKSIGNITDIAAEEFNGIEKTQKIAILIVVRKQGEPTFEVFSNPEITIEKESQFLLKLRAVSVKNTRLTDFPLLILLNSKFEEYTKDFEDLITPVEKKNHEYHNAGLGREYELNKEYATEALSVLSAYEVIVDDKFAGVKGFGNLVAKTSFQNNQDIAKLTSENSDYWRAIMEMSSGNQLIPVTKVFMLVAQGEFDYAMKYIEIIRAFSDPKSVPDKYLREMANRLEVFNQKLDERIKEGIEFHDNGEYTKAIGIYNSILDEYPNSAWAKYELFYSKNALSIENKVTDTADRTDWDNAKLGIYKSNPLYPYDVRASNSREGYLVFRRAEILKLFEESKNRMDDIYKYAEISMDLEVFDFAAHLFWISFSFNKTNTDALYNFLYCLEKLGVSDLKENFKGDFKKEFKKIEKNANKRMTESDAYKLFKG